MTSDEFKEYVDQLKSAKVLKVGLGSYLVYQLIDSLMKDDEIKGAKVMLLMQQYVQEGRND